MRTNIFQSWRFVTKPFDFRLREVERSSIPGTPQGLGRALWLALNAIFGAGWPTWTPDLRHACVAPHVDRRADRSLVVRLPEIDF